ncbi:MAG: ABC transporter substrate-binding protein [Dehalococcoidia bacterium]
MDAAAALPEQPDDLTYVFKLTPGIKFQNLDPVNGRELTSEDVKFSIERQMTDEAGKFQHAYFYRGKVDHIETPDKQTVVVKMSRKFAPFLAYAANAWSLITAPEIISKFGDLTQNMVGTGPFIFKGWQKDVRLDFEKNPDYFRKGKPYIDKLAYLVAVDPDVAATLFIEKKVDAVSLTAQQGPRVKDGRKDATYRAQPQQGMAIMRMPPTLAGPALRGPVQRYPRTRSSRPVSEQEGDLRACVFGPGNPGDRPDATCLHGLGFEGRPGPAGSEESPGSHEGRWPRKRVQREVYLGNICLVRPSGRGDQAAFGQDQSHGRPPANGDGGLLQPDLHVQVRDVVPQHDINSRPG